MVELVDNSNDRETANAFGDQTIFLEIFWERFG